MNRLLSATLLFFAILAWPVISAPPSEKPTMNPELGSESSAEKKDPSWCKEPYQGRPKDAKTEITSKKQATFDNATSVAEFDGSVVVKDAQFTLFCDQLRVTLSKDRKGASSSWKLSETSLSFKTTPTRPGRRSNRPVAPARPFTNLSPAMSPSPSGPRSA